MQSQRRQVPAPRDLTGMRFGRLTVVSEGPMISHRRHWNTDCECGEKKLVARSHLLNGNVRSCGCLHRERMSKLNLQHNMTGTPEYKCWLSMNRRCVDPRYGCFGRYGGDGIVVCDRWKADFTAFFLDMGPRPSLAHSLDRYPNQRGNYEPGNVRWATQKEQQRNRTNNVVVEFNGERACLSIWSERTGIEVGTLCRRIERGWTVEEMLTIPVNTTNRIEQIRRGSK